MALIDGATARHLAVKENNEIIKDQYMNQHKGQIRINEELIKTGREFEVLKKSSAWIQIEEWIKKGWNFSQMFAEYTKEDNKEGFDVKMKELNGINKLIAHIDTVISNGIAAQKRLEELQKSKKDQ